MHFHNLKVKNGIHYFYKYQKLKFIWCYAGEGYRKQCELSFGNMTVCLNTTVLYDSEFISAYGVFFFSCVQQKKSSHYQNDREPWELVLKPIKCFAEEIQRLYMGHQKWFLKTNKGSWSYIHKFQTKYFHSGIRTIIIFHVLEIIAWLHVTLYTNYWTHTNCPVLVS